MSVEADGDYGVATLEPTGSAVSLSRLGANILFHARALGLYLGGGYEHTYNSGALTTQNDGGRVILGTLLSLGGRAGFRLEARAAYLPRGGAAAGHAFNLGTTFGLSVFAFGGRPRDSDGDGVPDRIDKCPNTPHGVVVDARGCPIDSDGDGVADYLDRCPNTPHGAVVDAKGCPIDSDGDGVPDGIDQCPNTPKGVAVDAKGCPLDSDGDGVPDYLDRCPNTPPGVKVDANGCPVVQQTVQAAPRPLFQFVNGKAQPLILKGVTFRTGRSDLTPSSSSVLSEVAASLLANPEVKIEIGGHTDATGSRHMNLNLSLARALAVRTFLISKGVSPERLVAQGYGPDRPIASNRTPEGRAQNRRVELTLLETKPPPD